MELTPGASLHGFDITRNDPLPEIDGDAIEARHAVSGARLLYLKNDDNNKSFAIGFRTPPKDDTGVFHILEHSVLCGSRRFPVKEPFVDLLKSSMQTFLNAITFSDKTMYPVASTNEQDLYNLMDVYLDAVFHPNIYEKRQIFEQEGWHYELQDAEEGRELMFNGVVFNEMKGALSDANSVLFNALQAGLFPDNCYAFESGGTPAGIPTLTYAEYLDEHRRHYRTDNSYIILYGNLDIDRALAFLDERYLTPVAAEQVEHDEERKKAGLELLRPRTVEHHECVCGQGSFPMRTAPENACAGTAYVIGDSSDRMRVLAADILLDALTGSNEAPLKRRLLDKGVAHEISAFVYDAVLQPFAVIELQMPNDQLEFSYSVIIENEVKQMLDEGLDHELVEAALSHEEFVMREHDFGLADGVIYSMNALAGWLYDDDAATTYLRYEDAFAELRRALDEGYFEKLMRELFCDTKHRYSAEVVPNPDAYDGGLSDMLAKAQKELTPEKAERIDAEVALLRELQEAPDAPEATATLPRLGVSDISDVAAEPAYGLVEGAPIPTIRHEVPTRGIVYAYRYFDLSGLSFDDLPYAAMLSRVLGKLDTTHHTAAELDTLMQGKLGNLTFFTEVMERGIEPDEVMPKLVVSGSALASNVEWLATLPREIMLETDFSDTNKILDVLKQRKIALENMFTNNGHSCALSRVKSYCTPTGVVREKMGNVGYYRFLCDLLEHFDERRADLSARLADVARRLFCDDRCLISFAGTEDDLEHFWAAEPLCGRQSDGAKALVVPEPAVAREAFVTPSDVCFVGYAWDRRLLGGEHSGAWLVASRALSYDFLWNEVRVKGGAYGTGFSAMRSGNLRFYSYRDPHLDETMERFAQTPGWLEQFDPTQEALEGFKVATVAGIDAPVKPRTIARRQMNDYFIGQKPDERAQRRQQVIDATVEEVRALAPTLQGVIDAHAVCVFGNREIMENASADLTVIPLVG